MEGANVRITMHKVMGAYTDFYLPSLIDMYCWRRKSVRPSSLVIIQITAFT